MRITKVFWSNEMASQKLAIRNQLNYDAVLLDIEGTTTPISFVKVRIMRYLHNHMNNSILKLEVRLFTDAVKKNK